MIGEHYGPKPNPAIRELLAQDNFFKQVITAGKKAALVEAYPPMWHHDHNRGKSLRSSYQQAAYEAGQELFGIEAVIEGKALTPEWTSEAWLTYLKLRDVPPYTPEEAGQKLVRISREYDFAMHAHWMTDMVGHRGPVERGVELLELFDKVMTGVVNEWDDEEGLIIITSDHGNLEDVSHRNHTENEIPTLIIGSKKGALAEGLRDLSDYVPRMAKLLLP
jgi:2,3-bisphosphoglycerate-independent phosphoglycerate mutase